MIPLTGLPLRLWGYIAAGLAFIAVLLKAYSAGRKSAVADQQESTLKSVGQAKETQDEVDRLAPDAVRGRLHDSWTRD